MDENDNANEPVTHMQYNALRDVLRREMNTRIDALEEKTEHLSEGIKRTVPYFDVQSNNNMEQLRKNIIADFEKMIWPQDYEANAHEMRPKLKLLPVLSLKEIVFAVVSMLCANQ